MAHVDSHWFNNSEKSLSIVRVVQVCDIVYLLVPHNPLTCSVTY